jgi:hypothetical protein
MAEREHLHGDADFTRRVRPASAAAIVSGAASTERSFWK